MFLKPRVNLYPLASGAVVKVVLQVEHYASLKVSSKFGHRLRHPSRSLSVSSKERNCAMMGNTTKPGHRRPGEKRPGKCRGKMSGETVDTVEEEIERENTVDRSKSPREHTKEPA
jgi:hypothetical protein